MRVDTFVVHVGDAVRGLVVLYPAARLLGAHPHRGAAGMLGARLGLAENALKGNLAETVDMPAGRAARRGRRDRRAKLRQLGQAVAETGIEIFVDDLGRRLDMGVGIPDLKTVFHELASRLDWFRDLY